MKTAFSLAVILVATPALADPGHVAHAGGHSHWLAAGVIAAALLIGGGVGLWHTRHQCAGKRA